MYPSRNLSCMWPNLFPAAKRSGQDLKCQELWEWNLDSPGTVVRGITPSLSFLGLKMQQAVQWDRIPSAQWAAFLKGNSQNYCPWRDRDSSCSEQSRTAGRKPSAKGLTVLTQKQHPSQQLLNFSWHWLEDVLLYHNFSS